MDASPPSTPTLEVSKSLARRLLTIGGNRLELLTVEVQEEMVRLLQAILLALGSAVFGLLTAITLTAALAVLFWESFPPWSVLLALAAFHAIAGAVFYRQLCVLLRGWQALPASRDQLRKDRASVETFLS